MAIFLLYGLVAVLWTASALDVTWDESQVVIGSSKSHTAKENCSSWLEETSDYGVAPFASPGYRVFRNVKDYGANGDDDQDDTNAIIAAISDGGRCDLQTCASSTRTPATVYFPSGTYYISKEIPVSYYTNLIGNPRCLPILKATKNFTGNTFIQGRANGNFPSANIFYRQIRNFIIDMTDLRYDMPPINGTGSFPAIWWPTAQATSLQNIVFKMSEVPGTTHSGVYMEDGSGGWLSDLFFYGGGFAANWGSQQFTARNLKFYNAQVAIKQRWGWSWTYQSTLIKNCSVGIDMSAVGDQGPLVSSLTFYDLNITDTVTGFQTLEYTSTAVGSLLLENLNLDHVDVAIKNEAGATVLAGTSSTTTIGAWGQGHAYATTGPTVFQTSIPPNPRPAKLRSGSSYYQRSKPQYADKDAAQFLSVKDAQFGAKGDYITDDTLALQRALNEAQLQRKVLIFPAGIYRVQGTITIPYDSKVVGINYATILGAGPYFSNVDTPRAVVRVGNRGDNGIVEWSDMIVATQGATAGAILIEWNLASPAHSPSGMWDVHTRIGGFCGSDLQAWPPSQCPKTPCVFVPPHTPVPTCVAAFMSMHVTPTASGLYMENVWLWTADHDLDYTRPVTGAGEDQITVYTGRGLYIDNVKGPLWLYGTAVEHHAVYEYQIVNSTDIVIGFMQTETAYYQPNPKAPLPFPYKADWKDPGFTRACATDGTTCSGYGLRIVDSRNISIYGAGLYSFFNNYDTTCSDLNVGQGRCQKRLFSVEGVSSGKTKDISVYNLNTIGAEKMFTIGGVDGAEWSDNIAGINDIVALFRV